METPSAAVRGLKNACRVFLKDLEALPEDAFTRCFGGKCRTVADIVYEVNLVNDHIGMVIRDEEPFPWPEVEGWMKAPEGFSSKADVVEAFRKSSDRIVETAESFSSEEIDAPLKIEDGETTRAERCRFMALHLWYHAGQLNFMQTLLGDDEWHWK